MSKVLRFEDIEFNGMYGDVEAEISPIIEDCSFDAHNGMGDLQVYGGNAITGFEVLQAYFIEMAPNGKELSEVELDTNVAKDLIEYQEDSIIEMFSDYLEEL